MTNEDTIETAFVIMRHNDGSYSATTDMSALPEAPRKANIYDIKQGCAEIIETIQLQAVRNVLSSVVTQNNASDSDKVSEAVRQSLVEKGLL